MASKIIEFFGYSPEDRSAAAVRRAEIIIAHFSAASA